MTIEGVDYLGTGPTPAQLVAAGRHFRFGYLDRPDSSLTRADIDAHHAAGIDIGLFAEWGSQRMLGGNTAGVVDGQRAQRALAALGAPNGVAVYFAADWDVQRAQYPVVEAYLGGAVSVLGKPISGLYGGLDIVSHVKAAGLVTYYCQTYAWSAGIWAPGVHVQQYNNGQYIGGHEVDYDRAMVADFGQWKAGTDVGLSIKLAATASATAPWGSFGTAINATGTGAKRVADGTMVTLTKGQNLGVVQKGTLLVAHQTWAANSPVYVTNDQTGELAIWAPDVTFTPIAPPVPPAPPTQTVTITGQNVTIKQS
jgi:Rv2525c-like, glycoside hydrolase-like domain